MNFLELIEQETTHNMRTNQLQKESSYGKGTKNHFTGITETSNTAPLLFGYGECQTILFFHSKLF